LAPLPPLHTPPRLKGDTYFLPLSIYTKEIIGDPISPPHFKCSRGIFKKQGYAHNLHKHLEDLGIHPPIPSRNWETEDK
jgi:hypothetical protein